MDVGTACRMQGIGLKTSHLAESTVSTYFKRNHIASDDNSIVYAVTEQSQDAAVSSLSLDMATGRMEVLNSQPALGMSPCHIMIAGKDVVVSNYTSGSLAVFPLAEDGTLMPGTSVEFSESGPDTVRQASSHIHSSQLSPDGKHLYVIDLGGDCVHSYGVEDGRVLLSDYSRFSLAPGEGPRHFAYSAERRCRRTMWML